MNLSLYFGTRIKDLRVKREWRQEDLAKKIGITKTAIGNYERGEREPSADTLFKLSDVFGVSINYFFPTTVDKTEIQDMYDQLSKHNQKKAVTYISDLLEEQNKPDLQEASDVYKLDDYVDVDYHGALSAGTGQYVADNPVETISVPSSIVPNTHYDLVLKVVGDSMIPLYRDGEYVFIQKTHDLRSGVIGAVIINGEAFLKKIYIEDDHLRLVSLNSEYDDIIVNGDDSVSVVGRVI